MIKSILFVVVALFPACLFCQEIKANEVDPFTNERTIETTFNHKQYKVVDKLIIFFIQDGACIQHRCK